LQVFLATDSYEYNADPNTISVTSLIKPLRQLILGKRTNQDDAQVDLSQMVASRVGTAIHDAIERSWVTNYKQALSILNYPESVVNRFVINKPVELLTEDDIPIYLEQRVEKEINGYKVSGKFDMVLEGRVEDFKTTSVYTAINNRNDKKYVEQLSIYRWLNPNIVTSNLGAITYIFTDWSAAKSYSDKNYPQKRYQQKVFNLMSLQETEQFIVNKLNQIKQYSEANETDLPQCNADDLWRSDPVFKYYKDPNKLTKSTKNFDNKADAYIRLSQEGVGVVLEKPGQATACRYCSGYALCSQKDSLIANGELIV
jgi:hypothetical protein